MEFRKAQKSLSYAKICLNGPAGSGKTWSSLEIATGLGGKITMLDTEGGSGDLYSDKFDYDILTMEPDYTCAKYIEVIDLAEKLGYENLIIDSLTHAWAGEGGLLDKKGRIEDTTKNNGWTAWRMITPDHNKLVEKIISSKINIIATARSKMGYAQEEEGGKQVIKKLGMAPILREGMEYEFTVVLDITTPSHVATSTKDRTSLFDGKFFKPDKKTGEQIKEWLSSKENEENGNKTETEFANFVVAIKNLKKKMTKESYDKLLKTYAPLKQYTGDKGKLTEIYNKFLEKVEK
jgi:hypothetical protein